MIRFRSNANQKAKFSPKILVKNQHFLHLLFLDFLKDWIIFSKTIFEFWNQMYIHVI